MDENRQQKVPAKTKFRHRTVYVKTECHLRRWTMISFRSRITKAKIKFHQKRQTMSKLRLLTRTAKIDFRQAAHTCIWETSKGPYVVVCTFNDSDNVTLFTNVIKRTPLLLDRLRRVWAISTVFFTPAPGLACYKRSLSNPIGFRRSASATVHD